MIRRRCVQRGHKWNTDQLPLPVEYCQRLWCDAQRVNETFPMPPALRRALESELNRDLWRRVR